MRLIAPADFAPDQTDPEVYPGRQHLYDWFLQQVGGQNVTPVNPVNAAARELDRQALERCTTDFNPGLEFSPLAFPTIASIFFPAAEVGDGNELRVLLRESPLSPGASPGEMTMGLCSPWQFDFLACTCSFWAAQRPDSAFKDEHAAPKVKWLRKRVEDTSTTPVSIGTNAELIQHVDKLGVLRVRSQQVVESERTNDIP